MSSLKELFIFYDKNQNKKNITVGFDGFIDNINCVVKNRIDKNNYESVSSITQFAKLISSAADKSINIELIPKYTKIGGNGPIMANSLIKLNNNVTYIGALGKNEINPVFSKFTNSCLKIISVSDPGTTEALEFKDGKIMLGKITPLKNINWENIFNKIKKNNLEKSIFSSDLFAINNWTMLPELNSIVSGLTSYLTNPKKHPKIFLDLSDPTKRRNNDILIFLKQITKLATVSDLILGLNQNEFEIISNLLDIKEENELKKISKIREKINILGITVHNKNRVITSTEKFTKLTNIKKIETPKLSTGAGDNYNAGFCSAWLLDIPLNYCQLWGIANSHFYIENGFSASKSELIETIKKIFT